VKLSCVVWPSSVKLGGGHDASQDEPEASKQVPVACVARHPTHVVHDDHERSCDEEGEHQDGYPGRAYLAGDVARAVRLLYRSLGALRLRALCGYATALHLAFGWLCHDRQGSPASRVMRMSPRVVVIDNYDSFVYILVQYLGELGADISVHRHDEITVEEVRALNPDGILISPGPGTPDDAGISLELIEQLGPTTPILGVCLGHQCIGQVFGGDVVRAPSVMHGKTSVVNHTGQGVFAGLDDDLTVTRYHSLVVEPSSVPQELEVTATSADGIVMGLRHRTLPIEGVQFHPESVLTDSGHHMLTNFLSNLT